MLSNQEYLKSLANRDCAHCKNKIVFQSTEQTVCNESKSPIYKIPVNGDMYCDFFIKDEAK